MTEYGHTLGLYRQPRSEQRRVLALLGVLTGERADEGDREAVDLLELDAPSGELVRPPWLEATDSGAADRGDLFRVA